MHHSLIDFKQASANNFQVELKSSARRLLVGCLLESGSERTRVKGEHGKFEKGDAEA